ncbi:aldo/keto reductase [Paenibacillus glucanolyticus]|uniref:Aldo/keto reductase n=3 Tax=Paenibacillaceae TaxID=186822 RepID=A0A7Z2VT16_9BACL|nr:MULTISPECIES: aldo/keto reductase [Paenibacillaceae]MCK8487517.1 aldo/keto reductase [Paenibacillus mellifer]MCT1400962.1 aldo/keto reductase [Paenibacillus sp. p3-SID867]QJD88517.1 aldo/keto reductase [Cohnella herbarum]
MRVGRNGVTPWSPLARGRLSPPWEVERKPNVQKRTVCERKLISKPDMDKTIVDRLAEVAGNRSLPMTQITLAWLLSKPVIAAPLVDATKIQYIEDAVTAVSLHLSEEEISLLKEPYLPHAPLSHYRFLKDRFLSPNQSRSLIKSKRTCLLQIRLLFVWREY